MEIFLSLGTKPKLITNSLVCCLYLFHYRIQRCFQNLWCRQQWNHHHWWVVARHEEPGHDGHKGWGERNALRGRRRWYVVGNHGKGGVMMQGQIHGEGWWGCNSCYEKLKCREYSLNCYLPYFTIRILKNISSVACQLMPNREGLTFFYVIDNVCPNTGSCWLTPPPPPPS